MNCRSVIAAAGVVCASVLALSGCATPLAQDEHKISYHVDGLNGSEVVGYQGATAWELLEPASGAATGHAILSEQDVASLKITGPDAAAVTCRIVRDEDDPRRKTELTVTVEESQGSKTCTAPTGE